MRRVFLVALCVAVCAQLASAGTVVYTTGAGFNTATTNSTDTFSSFAPGNYNSITTTNFVALGSYSGLSIENTGSYGTGKFLRVAQAPMFVGNYLYTQVMPFGVKAVGFNYASAVENSVSFSYQGGGGTSITLPASSSLSFVGIAGTRIIESFTFGNGGFFTGSASADIDNFTLGQPIPGHVFSGDFTGLPANITLSHAALVVEETDALGAKSYGAVPLDLVAQSGGIAPPPPVKWQGPPVLFHTDGQGGASHKVGILAEYTDSNSGEHNVALLASAGGVAPPPPVLNGKQFEEVVNGVSEPDLLFDIQNLPLLASSGGMAPPPPVKMLAFMQNNEQFMYPIADGGSFTGGELWAFSAGHQIGTATGSEVVFGPVPEPATVLLLNTAAILFTTTARRARRKLS